MKNREQLETLIKIKEWTTEALENDFGGLTPQDFVNLDDLLDIYCMEKEITTLWAELAEMMGVSTEVIKLSDNYKTDLIGLYAIIGKFIKLDREFRNMSQDEKTEYENNAVAWSELIDTIREIPEIKARNKRINKPKNK